MSPMKKFSGVLELSLLKLSSVLLDKDGTYGHVVRMPETQFPNFLLDLPNLSNFREGVKRGGAPTCNVTSLGLQLAEK